MARAVYGDARLWFRLADANGLTGGPSEILGEGLTLALPNLDSGANSVDTFRPYDPSAVNGHLDAVLPDLPMPQDQGGGGCGAMGNIIMLAVTLVVAYYTGQAATSWLGSATGGGMSAGAAAVVGGAAGGAAGSIAGQVTGNALGVAHGFSWNQVAMGAIGGGVAGGLSTVPAFSGSATTLGSSIARGAIGSAITQGVAVVTGLQDHFDWTSVAASAVGAGVGYGVNAAIGNSFGGDTAGRFAKGLVSGLASGAAVNAMRGGKVSIQQIATDAFGNALGDSFVDMMRPTDNRHLLNTVNQASDPDYYSIDNRAMLNAANQAADPDYYGSQSGAGAGGYQFGELGSGSFGIGLPVSDQVLAMAEEARGGRILTQMRDAEIDASRTYTVRSGQTLSGITGRNDPAYLDQLAQYNGLASRHEVLAGQVLQMPGDATLAGVVVSSQVADRGAAGGAYYANRQAEQAALAASAQAATDIGSCTPGNPYGVPLPKTAQEAAAFMANMRVGNISIGSDRPSFGQSFGGALEVSGAGLWNGLVVNSVAGLSGIASLPFGTDTAVDSVRAVQGFLSYDLRSDAGKYHANWLKDSSFVRGMESWKSYTGDYYSEYGPMAGALGYTAPDALLMLLPAAPKAFTSFGGAIAENAFTGPVSGGMRAQRGAIDVEAYANLRRQTPSNAIRDMVNPEGPKIDPVYGYGVYALEADHIVSMKQVTNMPGFDLLPTAKQVDVLNLPDNFMGLGKSTNASKGAKSWSEWQGHSQLGPVPDSIRTQMLQREAAARAALENAIQRGLANGK